MSFADGDRLDNNPSVSAQINVVNSGSSLSGYVYADANGDGIRNLGVNGAPVEIGLPNVTISLFAQGATAATATTTTGPDGWYDFENVQPGLLRIVETHPAGFLDGKDTLGTILPGGQASGTVGNDEFDNVNLGAGQQGVDYNFGEVLAAASINKTMLLGSSPPMEVAVANQLGVPAVAVKGTTGNDAITVNNTGTTIQVSVNNGPAQSFDISKVKMVVVDGGGGVDTVTVNGTSAPELAHFQPTYVGVRRSDLPLVNPLGYGILVQNSQNLIVNTGSNPSSFAVFQDSPGNDTATASGSVAAVTWGQNVATAQAQSFAKVRLVSTLGGTDKVVANTPNFVLEKFGNWN